MNKFQNSSKPSMWVMGLLMAVFVAGCGSDGDGSTQPGVLAVSLTDAPACGYEKVNVTVSKVRVHQSDNASDDAGGWTDITLDPPRKINLLDLNDPTQPNLALESLGETPLAAGHYTQLRLLLVPNGNNPNPPFANSVVLEGQTTEIALETPSGIQSGIKLIHQFTVDPGQRVGLVLDFDACKSVVKRSNGTYALKPVIKVIPFVLNGIEGFVDPLLFPNQVNVNKVVVSAQVNGEIVRATVPNTSTGKFFLARLTAGINYDVVITADGRATAVIARVPVASSTSITTVSTGLAPFTLQASGTHGISGTVTLNPATDEKTVLVAAKQTLNSTPTVNPAPTVTVKSLPATVLTGLPTGDYSYALTLLPVGAPSLGLYGPLPITLDAVPQSSVAGQYAVSASAADYATQSFNKDISAANATQDFALVP